MILNDAGCVSGGNMIVRTSASHQATPAVMVAEVSARDLSNVLVTSRRVPWPGAAMALRYTFRINLCNSKSCKKKVFL